jgi:hypothetical protein
VQFAPVVPLALVGTTGRESQRWGFDDECIRAALAKDASGVRRTGEVGWLASMSGLADPQAFARRWIAAWNARDLEAVLAMFTDGVVFTSPLALRLQPESHGVVRGKEALRQYWQTALDRAPDLRFELTGICAGVDSLLIGFRNQEGIDRVEILRFRDGLVTEGHGTYALALT